MGKRKVNPRNVPVSAADVKKAEARATELAEEKALLMYAALFLTVLLDKYNGADYINSVWNDVVKLAEEVSEGRVSVVDLLTVLRDEYHINPVITKSKRC